MHVGSALGPTDTSQSGSAGTITRVEWRISPSLLLPTPSCCPVGLASTSLNTSLSGAMVHLAGQTLLSLVSQSLVVQRLRFHWARSDKVPLFAALVTTEVLSWWMALSPASTLTSEVVPISTVTLIGVVQLLFLRVSSFRLWARNWQHRGHKFRHHSH